MNQSYAMLAQFCPDQWFPHMQELLAWHMLCPISCVFARGPCGEVKFAFDPSPMHWSRQVEWPWVLHEAEFKYGHKVLDIGSGHSVLKYSMARRTYDGQMGGVTAMDINPEFIAKTQPVIEMMKGWGVGGINQVCGDALQLPFAHHTFDRVVSVSVLEHIKDGHLQCVKEVERVLKPGGMALITMDMVISGTPGDGENFYVTQKEAEEILNHLKINRVVAMAPNGPTMGAKLKDENVEIVCLMIKWVKEGG